MTKSFIFYSVIEDCNILLNHQKTSSLHDRGAVHVSVAQGTLTASIPYHLKPVLLLRRTQKHPQRCPEDRAVLKARLAHILPSLPACTHLRGHGGLKATVRRVRKASPQHRYVCRTDVKSYYASIDHDKLLDQLTPYVSARNVMNLLAQYMRRTE